MSETRARPQFRLMHGVVVAAIALLALKGIGFMTAEAPVRNPPVAVGSGQAPGFGRVLTHARSDYAPPDPTTTGSVDKKPAPEPKPSKDAASAPIPAPPLAPSSVAERALTERLGERREELQQRSREMEIREKLIQEQERKLDDRFGQMKAAEEAQKEATAARAATEMAGLKSLVTMYESMKPKEAARVFDRLPLEILVSVVTQMNSRKMSEVLAAMSPDSAEKLTVALAKRARGGTDGRVSSAGAILPAGELQAIDPPPRARR